MYKSVTAALGGSYGLEIGGPSRVFNRFKILPVYKHAKRIDNVNFAIQTAWEQNLHDGGRFYFNPRKPPGTQWIREANSLVGIANETYDFVLSSHCLEHIANPLSALREWRRVVKPAGYLLLIVPDSAKTFDHRRPVTKIEHLLDDQQLRTGEDDLSHLNEILELHDLKRDPHAGTAAQFRERALRNVENRCLHHHVFDLNLLRDVLVHTGWEVLASESIRPVHLAALARKNHM
jgi:SAM-dependent methyltransferase